MNVLELKSISVSLRLYIKKNGGNTMDKTLNIFYTGDNEPIAIAEVKASLEKIKEILHGGRCEFMKLPKNLGIVRFAL